MSGDTDHRFAPNADDVPPGWALTTTRKIFEFVTSGSRGWAQYYSDEGSPFIRIGDLQRGTLRVDWRGAQRVALPTEAEGTRTRLHPGDLLISITADLGIVGLAPQDLPEAYINQHIALARPIQVDSRYLGWFLTSESGGQRQFRELRRGATKVGLGLDDIRSLEVPVAPLPEQRRIVAEIEKHFTRLDDAVATLERVQVKLKRARASVLKAAVEGRLVPTEAELARAEGRDYEPASVLLERILDERKRKHAEQGGKKKYKPPAEVEAEGLPALPQGWVWASADSLLVDIEAGKSFRCNPSRPMDQDVGIVKVSAVTWGTYDENEAKTVDDPAMVNPDYFIEKGDFLFSRANTIDLVGACVIASKVTRRTMLSDKILRLRIVDPTWDHWLLCVLRSTHGREQIESLATGNQDSMRNIGQDRIRRIAIPVPPICEQRRISAEVSRRLSVLDALEQTLSTNLARLTRLRQSILARAFSGKLVPQDPNDEPASALLERIRSA